MKRPIELVLLMALIAIPIRAEKYALLIGINDYRGDITPLRYCESDVAVFRQALIEVAGFSSDNIYLMTSRMPGQKEPTNLNVIKRLSILSERVKPEDTFIFYFAGHGISKDAYSFLLATNSDSTTIDTLKISAVPLDQVSQILSRIQAKQLLTIIDACRNDPESGRGEKDNLLTDSFSRGFKIKRTSDSSGRPKISATLYACDIGERAYEWPEKEHGVFSYYLLEGLKGKAANSQGEVVVTDLADYTQQKVVAWSQGYKGKKQTPWLDQSGGAKMILAEGVNQSEKPFQAGEAIVVDAEAEMWEMVKDTTDPSDMEEFLALFPSGKLAGVAKFKLKKLKKSVNRPAISTAGLNQGSTQTKTAKDGAKMVLIPAGPSTEAFYMDVYEVTNAQYGKFIKAKEYSEPEYWHDNDFNRPDAPVVGVTWIDAVNYAKWAGKRLPTEKEWEWAARGGLKDKEYPWGNDEGMARNYANFEGTSGFDKWSKTAPVGSFEPNGYGLYDMAGNVIEWCQDWYGSNQKERVLRGGSWGRKTNNLRVAARTYIGPGYRGHYYGFRCVSGSN
jgi:formylglycine-generating enzyme required for sulfatase activity